MMTQLTELLGTWFQNFYGHSHLLFFNVTSSPDLSQIPYNYLYHDICATLDILHKFTPEDWVLEWTSEYLIVMLLVLYILDLKTTKKS